MTDSISWREALYTKMTEKIRSSQPIPEDQRSADWRFFLNLPLDADALVIGAGWGTTPAALAPACRRVFVIDTDAEKIALVQAQANEIKNIIPRVAPEFGTGETFPVEPNSLDLVSVSSPSSLSLPDLLRKIYPLLKKGGQIYLSLPNRLGVSNFLGRSGRSKAYTIFSIRKIFYQEGFADLACYCPLPRTEGIPMFYIPFDNATAWAFFFRNVFPLFAAVSPEMKKIYALEYTLARWGVKIALAGGLTGLARYFAPGFSLIAKRT